MFYVLPRVLVNLKPRKGIAWHLNIGHTAPHRLTEDGGGLHCALKGSNRENSERKRWVGMNIRKDMKTPLSNYLVIQLNNIRFEGRYAR